MDWLAQIVAEAEAQGFAVRQTRTGAWVFVRDGKTFIADAPASLTDWLALVKILRAMGLDIPD